MSVNIYMNVGTRNLFSYLCKDLMGRETNQLKQKEKSELNECLRQQRNSANSTHILKVSKFQNQIFLFSFPPKTERYLPLKFTDLHQIQQIILKHRTPNLIDLIRF